MKNSNTQHPTPNTQHIQAFSNNKSWDSFTSFDSFRKNPSAILFLGHNH